MPGGAPERASPIFFHAVLGKSERPELQAAAQRPPAFRHNWYTAH